MEGPGGPQPCVKGEGGRRAGGRRLECLVVCALCLGNLLLLLGVGSGPGRGGWLLASTYRLLVSWLVVNNSFVRGILHLIQWQNPSSEDLLCVVF